MRVDDLLAMPSLGLKLLAGEQGTVREVLWAHSCELVEPEQWLGPHELLMTVGLCVPVGAEHQAAFIGRLDEAGLAGLVVGDHEPLPELTSELFKEADARNFPVMLAAEDVPYAVVARHVAAANSSQQILQVVVLSKMYRLTSAAGDRNPDILLTELSNLLQVGLQITDNVTGLTLAASKNHRKIVAHDAKVSQVSRHRIGDTTLSIYEYANEYLDSFLLVHLLQIMDVLVERAATIRSQKIGASAETLAHILADERTGQFEAFLKDFPEADGYRIVIAPEQEQERLARATSITDLPAFVGHSAAHTVSLVPEDMVQEFRALAHEIRTVCGVSSVFKDYRDIRIAVDEATRVFYSIQEPDIYWKEFEGSTVALFVRSRSESEEIIRTVLGPLAQDIAAMRKLRETLFAFLTHDRQWQKTADSLNIHRQTLSYRLNRIEEETGLNLNKSADLSAVWIAYQAWLNLYG